MKNNNVYTGNCVYLMSKVPNDTVDLTITSPPYDNLRKYNGYKFPFECIANELYRITSDGGIVVWVVNDATIKGSETGSSFKQALYFMECGFNLNDTMIWRKTNPMPQVRQPRYAAEFEYMFVFSKGKPRVFNPIMVPTKCGGKKYESTARVASTDHDRKELNYVVNKEKVKGAIWDLAISQNKTKHPAVFPLELAKDHVKSWSNEGDLVFDPMCGSGTTLLAAKDLGRNYLGFDVSEEYVEISKNRLK